MPFLHTAERWCVPCRSLIAAMTQSVHGSDFRRVHGRDAQAHDLLESCTWRTNLHLHLLSRVWLHHLQVPRTVQLHHPDPIHCKPKDANRFERIRHSHRTRPAYSSASPTTIGRRPSTMTTMPKGTTFSSRSRKDHDLSRLHGSRLRSHRSDAR